MKSRYTKDYEYRDVVDENGRASSELVYTGIYHDSTLTPEQLLCLRRRSLLASGLALVLLAFGGFFSSSASRSFLVMIPYLACLSTSVFFLAGAVMLCRVPNHMTEKQYEHSYARTARSSILTGFFGVAAGVADGIFLVLHSGELVLPGDLLLEAALILTAVTAILFYRRCREFLQEI
ncbi:MAG: hypothetical protein Q4B26_02665 [Eubacteriales bacterium]|nr:hypothetical protein [Eubacteriales bacterium]